MNPRTKLLPLLLAPLAFGTAATHPSAQVSPVTTRVSVSSTGVEANGTCITNSNTPLSLSAYGRFVAFNSIASNLVAGDTNGAPDVFVRDLVSGTTERASVSSSGQQGNGDNYGRGSYGTSLSADGRYVAFYSYSSNLVAGDTGGWSDVFVRDRQTGTTVRVSVSTSNKSPNGSSQSPAISADGRYVVFDSHASNLVANDRNRFGDVFVRDQVTRTTQRISVTPTGGEGNGGSHMLFCGNTLSADGRCVVLLSVATNLVAGDTNGALDTFVRDLATGTTERVSVSTNGVQADGASQFACISGDGRFVAFVSSAPNLAPAGAPAGRSQLYVHDRVLHTTSCASLSSTGQPADLGIAPTHVALTADGRYLVFASWATNLVADDVHGTSDLFVRDQLLGTTTRILSAINGGPADVIGHDVAIDASGLLVAFVSAASNLVGGDTNGVRDVFVVR